MPELPSGTVTLLFTDIEGSTRLLRELRDDYQTVLADHRRLMREAFAQNGGQEIGTEGDSFFVVFRRAKDGVAAAAQAQRALAHHPWPKGVSVRVRMGMHTGEPTVGETGDYVGLGVHRAARIMAAGHGGQVLLSQTTRELLLDDPPVGLSMRDLGDQQLKDFDQPERIWQLVVPGLPDEFPPLKTRERQPTEATPFGEREEELAEAAAMVAVGQIRRRRRLILVLAAALAAGAITAVIVVVAGGSGSGALSRIAPNAVGMVSATHDSIRAQVRVGASPSRVAVGAGGIWITNFDDQTVSRVDPDTHTVAQTIRVGSGPSGIAVGNNAVWIANNLDGTISRINPQANRVVQTIRVGNGPTGVAYGAGALWVANAADQTVSRIDSRLGRVTNTISAGNSPTELAVGGGAVWASSESGRTVARIDPRSRATTQTIIVGSAPTGLAYGGGALWVANSLDGTVSRIEPDTGVVTATIRVGDGPSGVAAGDNSIWVTNEFGGTLSRIDPRRNAVVKTINVGNRPQGVAVAKDSVWVTVHASGAGHRGGRYTLLLGPVPLDSIDPAYASIILSQATLVMTNDTLTTWKRVGGADATQLVPDLATSLPNPTEGGRTYSFRLRRGIRYSTGREVKPADLRYAIERLFRSGSPGARFYLGIEGALACGQSPNSCDLSRGITTNADTRTITFHLTDPDPEFPEKLALTYSAALPVGTPVRPSGPVPATGPYKIVKYIPGRKLILVRNPHFREWSKAAQPAGFPDTIMMKLGGDPDAAVDAIESGKADWLAFVPPNRLGEVQTQYPGQVHVNPLRATLLIFLNTRVPPFDDVRVRRAVNYALDRDLAVKQAGGPAYVRLTCQLLPPNFPGYRRYCPYTLNASRSGVWHGPDLAKARRLVAASRTQGMTVTVWTPRVALTVTVKPFLGVLKLLGYKARLKQVDAAVYQQTVADSRTRAQAGFDARFQAYGSPSAFLNSMSCRAFRRGSPQNENVAEFCDPDIDDQMERALTLQAIDPQAANELWSRIEHEIVDQAPILPVYNLRLVNLVARRVGNYEFNPQIGFLIDQMWVR